jgi:hypothetical protein
MAYAINVVADTPSGFHLLDPRTKYTGELTINIFDTWYNLDLDILDIWLVVSNFCIPSLG